MGKRKLIVSVVTGAALGGLVALFDKETRTYTKSKLGTVKRSSSYLLKNPSEAVHNVRVAFDTFNKNFANGAENAINALEQVENSLDKITNKNEADRIE
ncbi:YtxH domain-containing protein [Virgibacillus sp. YIM 98842]|uniref:YtxH domain-containing protein n=1 Tax=Virgibacillus sp. YIM 98842 TaxID=2663533 RepID=UPI0013DCAE8D|nr:YtxH domain-containing protein [Virgibacillus sp. YIM 98842]